MTYPKVGGAAYSPNVHASKQKETSHAALIKANRSTPFKFTRKFVSKDQIVRVPLL